MLTAETGLACAHCGLAVPAALVEEGADLQFCCHGCRTVWAVLHDHGLGEYYAVRRAAGAAATAVIATGRSYAELDDAAFQTRACRGVRGGLLETELYLEGVHCAACVWLVERLPRLLGGLAEVRLDLPRSRARLRWDPRVTSLSAAARLLESVGYAPHPVRGLATEDARRREDRAMLARIGLAGAAAVNVMAIAFGLYGGMLNGIEPEFEAFFRWTSLAITLPAMIWGGGVFFRGAWTGLRVGVLHMDLPISLGLLAGFLHGTVNTVRGEGDVYFDSVTALVFLLLAGRYLQRREQRAAGDAAELLAALAPSVARVLEDGAVREVPLDALLPGMIVEVRAGDTVPADGVVLSGHSALDVSLLSGESRPLDVGRGDVVHAGTVSVSGRLELRVDQTGEHTRAGRLMQLVEAHGRRRAPIVQLADRISGGFVAAVLGLAALTLVLWVPRVGAQALDHAAALLIVTCPCALGLATPLAVSSAIGQAARAGLLIKGADVLERLARPGRMWLDKTGTLTEGRVTLVQWRGLEEAKPLAAAVEAHSAHPVARALVAGLGAPAAEAVEVVETQGAGIEGWIGGRAIAVGSPAFITRRAGPLPPGAAADLEAIVADALTPVLVSLDGAVVAVAGLGDRLRADAAASLARVRGRGWRLGVLSGDDPRVVASAGRALGLAAPDCRGGVGPEEKLEAVTRALAEGPVVMVGDGVNDAAALAAATVGVAVHGGAEAALAAADVFVTRPGTAAIAELLDGAARTMGVVRRNLAFSLLYNVAGVALAITGLLNPLVAAILMPLSSLTVIVSSYRTRTFLGRLACR